MEKKKSGITMTGQSEHRGNEQQLAEQDSQE